MWDPDWLGHEPNRIVRQYAHLIRRGGYVLDLGAGNGRDSRFLAERGYRVRSVDICPEATTYLQSHCHPRVTVECADALSIHEQDGTVDGVVMVGILNSMRREDAAELLARARRWLTPDGVIILTVPLTPPEDSEEEMPEFDYTYAPGEVLDHFPGWHVHHHEEKRGMAFWVSLFVASKPERERR